MNELPLRRRGAVTPLVALLLVVLMIMLAFGIDLGAIALTRTQLQGAADAAATAAASQIDSTQPANKQATATETAISCAKLNSAAGKAVSLASNDITFGNWDSAKRTFTANAVPVNAARVVARRETGSTDGPLGLAFAPIFGVANAEVRAEAIGLTQAAAIGSRFLIDDEMIDSDIPVIEAVAKKANKSSEDVISDKDGDWWIDLHKYVAAGTRLELPTGQVGDEGLFDIEANKGSTRPTFPFTPTTTPSLENFLNYNEDSSSWRYNLISKSKLDPLVGVGRWNDPSRYASLVNPDFVHVSPVWKSDISALDGVGEPATKGVNALGLRRGLFAFKIVGVGADPDGSGSKLPNLIIEVVDPKTIDLKKVVIGAAAGGGRVRLVQ